VCEPRALHASGWATRSRRDSTRSRPVRQPPKRSGRPDLRGGAAELSVHDYLLKPGPGVSVCRMAPSALGRGCRRPGFNTHCWQGHKTESRSAHTSQAVGAPGFEPGTSCPPDCSSRRAGCGAEGREVASVQRVRLGAAVFRRLPPRTTFRPFVSGVRPLQEDRDALSDHSPGNRGGCSGLYVRVAAEASAGLPSSCSTASIALSM
jgi:hypothetical protein